jgi:hypothetical protein
MKAILALQALAATTAALPIVQKQITVGGYTCGTYQTAMIYHPSDAGLNSTYPLLAFGHGWTCGGSSMKGNYKEILEDLAADGYVVVASESGALNLCMSPPYPNAADQRRSLDFVLNESSEYGPMIDRTAKVGVYGHSMGGHASGINSADQSTVDKYNIGAAFLIHPAGGGSAHLNKVPAFYAAGSSDTITSASSVERMYPFGDSSKVQATIRGAGHFEANDACTSIGCRPGQKRWTPYIKAFFNCHLKDVGFACDAAYGICSNFDAGTLTKCDTADAPPPSGEEPPEPPVEELFSCAACSANGYGSDGCGCGHCGSFGACTFSCDPSSSYYSGKACLVAAA